MVVQVLEAFARGKLWVAGKFSETMSISPDGTTTSSSSSFNSSLYHQLATLRQPCSLARHSEVADGQHAAFSATKKEDWRVSGLLYRNYLLADD